MGRTTRISIFRLDPRPARGFSLFELVLVTAIAGTIAAIAMPRFAGAIARTRLERAVHRLTEDIELVRQAARAASATTTLVFDASTASYTSAGVLARDLSREPFSVVMPTVMFEGNQYVSFDGYGMPSASGLISIRSGSFVQTIALTTTGELSIGAITVDDSPLTVPDPIAPPVVPETSPITKPGGFVLTVPE